MFRTVFNPANGFWRMLGRFCDIFGLSICWLICSLPLFTIGASTTALYDAVFHGIRKSEPGDYARFFKTFRHSFRTATLVTLFFLLFAVLFGGVFYITYIMALDGNHLAYLMVYVYRVILCLPLAIWLFAMFTLSRFEFRPKELFSTSVKLVLGHLPSAAVVAILVMECAMSTSRWGVLPLVFMPALAVLISSLFMERIFAPYLPPAEDAETDSTEDPE